MVSVPVQSQSRPVLLNYPPQPGTAQEREDRFRLTYNRFQNRRIMSNRHLAISTQLRQAVVKLDGFTFGNFNEFLNGFLTERHQLIGCEAAAEALGPRKSNTVMFEACAIQHVDAGNTSPSRQNVLLSAFVIVVAEHGHHWDVYVRQDLEAGLHFFKTTVIRQISREHQQIRNLVNGRECPNVLLLIFPSEMHICDSCQLHHPLPVSDSFSGSISSK